MTNDLLKRLGKNPLAALTLTTLTVLGIPSAIVIGSDYIAAKNDINTRLNGHEGGDNNNYKRWGVSSPTQVAAMAFNTLEEDKKLDFIDGALRYYGRDAACRQYVTNYLNSGGNIEAVTTERSTIGGRTIQGISGDL